MVEIVLIRHGQTDSNLERRYQGHSDTSLNNVGRQQAHRLASRLNGAKLTALYSSDLARAEETADILGEYLSLPRYPLTGLREIDVGSAAGSTRDELRDKHPDLFGNQWISARFPCGESYAEMTERVSGTTRDLIAAHPDQSIGVVTHGGAIRALVADLAAIPLTSLVGMVVANTSMTRIEIAPPARPRLRTVNDAAHLEPWTVPLLGGSPENGNRPGSRSRG